MFQMFNTKLNQMPKLLLIGTLQRHFHLVMLYLFALIAIICTVRRCQFYNYAHIPVSELNSSLFKQVNINLNILENKPKCHFNFYNKTSINKSDVPKVYKEFSPKGINDGSFRPEHCNPEISVAILVTYRDRHEQLNIFLPYIHNFLRKQNIHYKIYLIEQTDERVFNKGLLYNIGAKIALSEKWPCLILHDVDLLPLNDANLYACLRQPRHLSGSIDTFRFVLTYSYLVGGVLAVTAEQYRQVNGFSNRFLGWGGEDDNFADRLANHQLDILRFPHWLSEYTMLVHRSERKNPARRRILYENKQPTEQASDGLNSLQYRTLELTHHRLYTRITVTT